MVFSRKEKIPGMKNWKGFALVLMFIFLVCGCKQEPLPNVNVTAYAAAYARGVYQTDNGGVSWFALNPDQEELYYYFKRIYADPANKNLLYIATTGNGLFRLDKTKGSLESLEPFRDQVVTALAFWNFGQNSILAPVVGTSAEGLFGYSESNRAWQPFNNGLNYREVNALFASDKDFFAATRKDLFRWDEKKQQWVSSSLGIKNKNIIAMACDPSGQILFAGAGVYEEKKGWFEDTPCLYKSTDQGQTWSTAAKGLADDLLIFSIAVNPRNPARIYLGTSQGVYRSLDQGAKWRALNKGLPKNTATLDIKIAPLDQDNDGVFIACGTKGLFLALDNEKPIWSSRSYGLEPTAITSLVVMP
jgi:ligand-binding sensor domain-containing protein